MCRQSILRPANGNEMDMMAFQRNISTGTPEFNSLSTAKSRVAGAADGASPIVRPVALDRGDLLRIRNGRGTRVRATHGVLWITEEYSAEDHVLLPGDSLTLAQTGMAIVLAHRPARVVIEVPVGVTAPRAVELTLGLGRRGMRIALADPTPVSLSRIVTGVATVVGNALASFRRIVTTLSSRWDAAGASAAKTRGPMYSDNHPRRHPRFSAKNGTRVVKRARS